MTSILEYFILFFLTNPFGMVALMGVVLWAEYTTFKSIMKDENHLRLIGYIKKYLRGIKNNYYDNRRVAHISQSVGHATLGTIRVPIEKVSHKIRKQKARQ